MHSIYKHSKAILITALVLVSLVACKKSFLEIVPKGRVIATKTSDYDLLLNNDNLFNLSNTDAQVIMGDEIVATDPLYTASSMRVRNLFKWADTLYLPSEDPNETLSTMKSLFTYNLIINGVLSSINGSEAEKKNLQAEALAGRAWTYFLMINYYGKPYNAATATTDPGFPIIKDADINLTDFKRQSVQEVYDFIISDLKAAIPNFTSIGVKHRLRMCKAGAEGLLGKVYLFMGKSAEAKPLLESAIADLALSGVNTNLYDYNTAYPGSQLAPNDNENIFNKQFTNSYSGSTKTFMLTPAAAALYTATDVRRIKWFTSNTLGSTVLLKKSGYTTTFFGLKVPDFYLLLAEAKARQNDLTGAVSTLELFRKKRMPAADAVVPTAIASDKVALLGFIMNERIREFAMDGSRWFDMRRLSVDPLFPSATFTHNLYSATGTISQSFTLKPERLTLRIPAKILLENPHMQDNP